ncbi:hypothetical protein JCM8547_001365 [Rhodosporidiobolus lusitaniae]
MAQTVAYWTVAYKRLLDNAPRVLDCVIKKLPTVIQNQLLTRLFTGDGEQIRRLMAEDAEVAVTRAELSLLRQHLEDAKRTLVELGHDL